MKGGEWLGNDQLRKPSNVNDNLPSEKSEGGSEGMEWYNK